MDAPRCLPTSPNVHGGSRFVSRRVAETGTKLEAREDNKRNKCSDIFITLYMQLQDQTTRWESSAITFCFGGHDNRNVQKSDSTGYRQLQSICSCTNGKILRHTVGSQLGATQTCVQHDQRLSLTRYLFRQLQSVDAQTVWLNSNSE